MLTNKALETITDFLSNLQSVGISSENYIPWDKTELLFDSLSEPYFKELRGNLLNFNREDASLYLCEAIESLSRFSELILPNNDEINKLLADNEAQNALILKIEQNYSEALTDIFSKNVEFKINLGAEFFRAEELVVRRDFREEVYHQISNNSFNPDTIPEDGLAWIYAEQVSFFLESIWLRLIELYERRCGAVPEALHWHSNSQWIKQHSQERTQLAVSEALLTALLAYGADESILAQYPTFKALELAPAITAATSLPGSQAIDTFALASDSPFTKLLLKYTLVELTALLIELGVLDKDTKQASPAASPGAWVGIIYALIDEKGPRLKGSKAAISKAFNHTFGAVVSERAVQHGLETNQSEAERFRDRALSLLKA